MVANTNILLTGGAGYIGSHTAIPLILSGKNIFLLDNFSNSNSDVICSLEKITSSKINFIEGDIRDINFISYIIKKNNIDAVIHFAGLKSVAESSLNPLKYYDNNLNGAINLLEAMKINNLKKIIFSSSATVYGEPKYLPYDESHPTNPINPYGRTKLYIEEVLKDLAKSDPDWSIICLRYFNPVGAHDSGLIGENPKNIPNNLMPYILDVATGKQPYLRVFGADYATHDGTGIRDYIHVMDLAEGHLLALAKLNSYKGCISINLGTGIGLSVLDILKSFHEICGYKIPYQIKERRQGDLAEYYASPKKAQTFLGWKAKKTIFDICKSSWVWANKLSKK